LRKYYEQAQKAIRYNDKSESTISYYRDFMLQDFLEEIRSGVKCRDYCHPGVMAPHEYDVKHHLDLCKTLFLYISCNKSTARVNDRLGIHKNTVNNRLNRITDMINFNVDDENETFHAMLTLMLVGQGE
jgi:sugar diacid utilization regulator